MRRRQHRYPATTPVEQWQHTQPYLGDHLSRPKDHLQDFKELGKDTKNANDVKDKRGEETPSGLPHLEGSLQLNKNKPCGCSSPRT